MKYLKFIESSLDVSGNFGDEYYCICPFHDDSRPSFYINVKTGLYFCHACHAKGNAQKLADYLDTALVVPITSIEEAHENLLEIDKQDSAKRICDTYLDMYNIYTGFQCNWYTDSLKDGGRGLRKETVDMFGLGYVPERKECLVPIWSEDGMDMIGIIRRKLNGKPKYVYPSGFNKNDCLFASWLAKEEQVDTLAIVEGPFDAIKCWDAGIPAVAVLGSDFSESQNKILTRIGPSIVYAFGDNDKAGVTLSNQIKQRVSNAIVEVVEYNAKQVGADPGGLSRSALRALLSA